MKAILRPWSPRESSYALLPGDSICNTAREIVPTSSRKSLGAGCLLLIDRNISKSRGMGHAEGDFSLLFELFSLAAGDPGDGAAASPLIRRRRSLQSLYFGSVITASLSPISPLHYGFGQYQPAPPKTTALSYLTRRVAFVCTDLGLF